MDSQYLGAIEPREQWYFVFLHCTRLFPQKRYTLPSANTTSELSIVPAAGSALQKSTMAGKTVLLQIISLWIFDDYESNVKYEQNSNSLFTNQISQAKFYKLHTSWKSFITSLPFLSFLLPSALCTCECSGNIRLDN